MSKNNPQKWVINEYNEYNEYWVSDASYKLNKTILRVSYILNLGPHSAPHEAATKMNTFQITWIERGGCTGGGGVLYVKYTGYSLVNQVVHTWHSLKHLEEKLEA